MAETCNKDEWIGGDSTVPSMRYFMLDDLSVVRELKQRILDRESGRDRVFGLQGSGGVGKTTACTIVARDRGVIERYKDARVWIQLAENAAAATVVKQVARIVRATGGSRTAAEIEELGEKDLDKVREKAAKWFNGKSIVLVVDNVFPTNSMLVPKRNWMAVLEDIPGANSCVLFTTRSLKIATRSDVTVKFAPLTSFEEQRKMVLRHLGSHPNAGRVSDEDVLELQKLCGGVPLALATVSSYLRSDHNNVRTALHALQESLLKAEEQPSVLGGHPGLYAIFGAVLRLLDEDNEGTFLRAIAGQEVHTSELPCSWTDLYCSLSVLDKAAAHAPIGILAGLWGIDVDFTQLVCLCFANLGLGTLMRTDQDSVLDFGLHDLHRTYCVIKNGHSSSPKSLTSWHARLLESLVRKSRETDCAVTTMETSLTGSSDRAARYVEAFCAIRVASDDDWMEQYWLDQFVRHVRGVDDGVRVAICVVTDYRWVRRVAERHSPTGVARVIEQLLVADEADLERPHEAGSSSGAARVVSPSLSAMKEQDASELAEIAHVFRSEIPPEAAKPQPNLGKEDARKECAVHPGEWSVGDPGLAHRIVGRLGFARGDSGAVESVSAGSLHVGGLGAIGALVDSVRTHARGPWLCPNHRCFIGTERDGLGCMIMHRHPQCCVAYSLENLDYVAIGCRDGKVHLHRADSGKVVSVLQDEGAEGVGCVAVSRALSTRGSDGTDQVYTKWLAAGHRDGVVRVWDVEAAQCVARLRAADEGSLEDTPNFCLIEIERDGGRVVAGDDNNYLLHTWDLSSVGDQRGYRCAPVGGTHLSERCGNQGTHFQRRPVRHACDSSAGTGTCIGNMGRDVHPDQRALSVSFVCELIRQEHHVLCARVQDSDARALLAAVDELDGTITVLDAVTGENLSESPPFRHDEECNSTYNMSCAAASHVDGRILVATGHWDGVVRIREASSGTLIGQRHTSTSVSEVLIDGAARRVMALFWDVGLLVASFAGDGSGQYGETTQRWLEDDRYVRPHQMSMPHLVGLSLDGQTAASSGSSDAIVWNAATGSSIRQLEYDGLLDWWPRAVAISDDGIWTLVVEVAQNHERGARLRLLDSSGEGHWSDTFMYDPLASNWSTSFTPDGQGCVVTVQVPERDTEEVHRWTISDAGVMEKVDTGTAPNLPPSACMHANRNREFLLSCRLYQQLTVRRSASVEDEHCTCIAVALFADELEDYCARSNLSTPGSSSARNLATVMVGLVGGMIHFMEFRV